MRFLRAFSVIEGVRAAFPEPELYIGDNEQYLNILRQEQVIRQALKVYQIKALAVLEAYYAEALIYDLVEQKKTFISELEKKQEELGRECQANLLVWGLDGALTRSKSADSYTIAEGQKDRERVPAIIDSYTSKLTAFQREPTNGSHLLVDGLTAITAKLKAEADAAAGLLLANKQKTRGARASASPESNQVTENLEKASVQARDRLSAVTWLLHGRPRVVNLKIRPKINLADPRLVNLADPRSDRQTPGSFTSPKKRKLASIAEDG
jgi:hypothetical protein